eukprot:scaffold4756_cov116-Isochrysis_galbana.AAC.10
MDGDGLARYSVGLAPHSHCRLDRLPHGDPLAARPIDAEPLHHLHVHPQTPHNPGHAVPSIEGAQEDGEPVLSSRRGRSGNQNRRASQHVDATTVQRVEPIGGGGTALTCHSTDGRHERRARYVVGEPWWPLWGSPWLRRHPGPWPRRHPGPWLRRHSGPWLRRLPGHVRSLDSVEGRGERHPERDAVERRVRPRGREVEAGGHVRLQPRHAACGHAGWRQRARLLWLAMRLVPRFTRRIHLECPHSTQHPRLLVGKEAVRKLVRSPSPAAERSHRRSPQRLLGAQPKAAHR